MKIRERINIRKEKKDWHRIERGVARGLVRDGKRARKRTVLGLYLTNEERESLGKTMEEHGKAGLRVQKQQRWKTSAFWRFVRWLKS